GGTTGGGTTSGGSTGSGSRSSPISFGGTSQTASPSSRGGGTPFNLPAGQAFAGRQVGGGTRDQVFGSRQYGSGYPGVAGRGVAGRGFPFYFWPVAWGGAAGAGTAAYLHNNEYGRPDNSSRPGGPMFTTTISSNTSATNRSTFHLISDNTTVVTLADIIDERCASLISTNSSTPFAFSENATNVPKPESAIQYYRASSVVLTLEGYNNSAVFSEDDNIQDSPLPNNVDTGLLDCLNRTIGENVPLVAAPLSTSSNGPGNGALRVGVDGCSTLALVLVLGHFITHIMF
ncbi:hypothetical protein MPER_04067, partial [Moniliophthora perniciosa FA553]